MKIFNWNCNRNFREDITYILDKNSDFYVDADIYVIQECENPDEPHKNYVEYKKLVDDSFGEYHWIGKYHYMGLGVFAKEHVNLELKGKWEDEFKYFILLRVNDSFNLLCVWAMPEYVEMIHDFFDTNGDLFDENLIICGDFNSNVVFNDEHTYVYTHKDKEGYDKHHTNLDWKLNHLNDDEGEGKGLFSVYHELSGEDNGKETQFTFFQSRHLGEPFYLDYVYANKEIIKKTTLIKNGEKLNENLPNEFEILDSKKWTDLSDHIPIVFKFDEKDFKRR